MANTDDQNKTLNQTMDNSDGSLNQSMQDMAGAAAKTSAALAESLVKINPCVPTGDPATIPKRAFDDWLFHIKHAISSMKSVDAKGHYAILRNTAGPQLVKLLDILDIRDDIPDAVNPFEKALEILTKHFTENTNYILERVKFRATEQLANEACVEYLNRLFIEAKRCGFSKDSIEAEIFQVVRTNARDSSMRSLAGENDCSVAKLRSKADNIDLDKAITASKKEKVSSINAVSQSCRDHKRYRSPSDSDSDGDINMLRSNKRPRERSPYQSSNNDRRFDRYQNRQQQFRGNSSREHDPVGNHPRGYYSQGPRARNLGNPGSDKCYRCGSSEHESFKCKKRFERCLFCGKMGHTESACYSKKRQEMNQRSAKESRTENRHEKLKSNNKNQALGKKEGVNTELNNVNGSTSPDEKVFENSSEEN